MNRSRPSRLAPVRGALCGPTCPGGVHMSDSEWVVEQQRENEEQAGVSDLERARNGEARLLEALRAILRVGNAQTLKGIDAWNHARKVASEYP